MKLPLTRSSLARPSRKARALSAAEIRKRNAQRFTRLSQRDHSVHAAEVSSKLSPAELKDRHHKNQARLHRILDKTHDIHQEDRAVKAIQRNCAIHGMTELDSSETSSDGLSQGSKPSRRDFLQTTGGAVAGFLAATALFKLQEQENPNRVDGQMSALSQANRNKHKPAHIEVKAILDNRISPYLEYWANDALGTREIDEIGNPNGKPIAAYNNKVGSGIQAQAIITKLARPGDKSLYAQEGQTFPISLPPGTTIVSVDGPVSVKHGNTLEATRKITNDESFDLGIAIDPDFMKGVSIAKLTGDEDFSKQELGFRQKLRDYIAEGRGARYVRYILENYFRGLNSTESDYFRPFLEASATKSLDAVLQLWDQEQTQHDNPDFVAFVERVKSVKDNAAKVREYAEEYDPGLLYIYPDPYSSEGEKLEEFLRSLPLKLKIDLGIGSCVDFTRMAHRLVADIVPTAIFNGYYNENPKEYIGHELGHAFAGVRVDQGSQSEFEIIEGTAYTDQSTNMMDATINDDGLEILKGLRKEYEAATDPYQRLQARHKFRETMTELVQGHMFKPRPIDNLS